MKEDYFFYLMYKHLKLTVLMRDIYAHTSATNFMLFLLLPLFCPVKTGYLILYMYCRNQQRLIKEETCFFYTLREDDIDTQLLYVTKQVSRHPSLAKIFWHWQFQHTLTY